MDPLSLVGLGVGLFGGIGKLFGRGAANRRLRQLQSADPAYTANPEAAQRLALAKTVLNARSPGAMQVERNIYSSGANAAALAQKASSDSSQLLAEGANIQGRTNQAFRNLGIDEANDWQRRYSNLVGAQEGYINEQDKVFQDQVRRWQDKAQIQGAIQQNKQSNWGDISNLGFGLMNFGLSGGFKNMFGGGGGGGMTPQMPTSFRQLQGPINIDYSQINSSYPRWP